MKNKKIVQSGVTYIELIITIGVLMVGILTLFLVIIYGIVINHHAKNLALSYEIANKEMETIRNTPFDNLVNQTEGNFYSDSDLDLAKLNQGIGRLTIEDYEESNEIKKIIVEVSWTEESTAKNTVFTTLIAQGGINQ